MQKGSDAMKLNKRKPPRRLSEREGESNFVTATIVPPPSENKNNNSISELGHDPIRQVPIFELHPSPENDKLYRPVRQTDPEIVELAKSIRIHGVVEPMVITLDHFILQEGGDAILHPDDIRPWFLFTPAALGDGKEIQGIWQGEADYFDRFGLRPRWRGNCLQFCPFNAG